MILANLPLLLFAAGVGVVILAVEDLLKAFSGGKSAVGAFMEYLVGDKNWERLRQLPKLLGDIMFEIRLSEEEKKKRGITDDPLTTKGSTPLFDMFATLFGEDPEERKKSLLKARQNYQMDKASRAGARAAERAANPSWFDSLIGGADAWKAGVNQTVVPALQEQAPQQFGWNGPVPPPANITVNIAGNADRQTVRDMTDALDGQARDLYDTTTSTNPDLMSTPTVMRAR